jgi:hypothetical protein
MSQAEKQLFDFLWTGCFFRSSDLMIWESSIVSQVLHSVSVRNSWPTHDEGSMVVTSKQLPGISLTESIAIGNEIERTIKSCGRLIEIKVRLFVAFGVLLSPQYQQEWRKLRKDNPNSGSPTSRIYACVNPFYTWL